MKKTILIMALVICAALSGCGNKTEEIELIVKPVEIETINKNENTESTEVKTEEVDGKDFEGDYTEMGEGIAYISTPSGTSEDGNVPVVFVSSDDMLIQIGFNAEGFDGGKISFIYIDGKLYSKEQLGDSQRTFSLEGDLMKKGVHKVEVVQYSEDDPASEVITYKTASYEIKEM